jgi:hypothetical protein
MVVYRETAGYIIHEILDMRKLSAKWVPKCLNADHKRDRVLASQATILRDFWITIDETWIHIYVWLKDQRIVHGTGTEWFTALKEIQDTEVIKKGVGVCLLEQRCNFACRLPGKGCNHEAKVLFCTSRQT